MNYFLKKKKWLAWVIMLTFLFTSFMPSNIMAGNSVAEAATGDDKPAVGVHNPESVSKNGVTLSKTAKQVGLDEYEVTLTISGGGSETQKKTIDVVLVLDKSSSMRYKCPSTSFTSKTTEAVCNGDIEQRGKRDNRYYVCEDCDHNYGGTYPGQRCNQKVQKTVYVCDQCGAEHNQRPRGICNDQQINDSPRNNATQNAAKGLVDTLVGNLDDINVNIGVVSFGKTATKQSGNSLVALTSANKDTVKGYITAAKATETDIGTNTSAGLYAAKSLLGNSQNEKFVILLSDGLPTYYCETSVGKVEGNGSSTGDNEWLYTGKAATAVKGLPAELYTVLLDGTNENYDALATDAGHALTASSADNSLSEKFNSIVANILQVLIDGSVIDTMGDNVTLIKDDSNYPITIDPEELTQNNGESVTDQPSVSANGDVITWDTGAFVNGSATLKYTVKLKDYNNPDKLIALNKDATLTYKYWDSAAKEYKGDSLKFPVPQVVYETGTLKVTASGLPEGTTIIEQTDGPRIVGRTTEEGVDLESKFNEISTSNEVVPTVPVGYELKSVNVTQGGTTTTYDTLEAFNAWYNQGGRNGVIDVVKGETKVEYVYGAKEVGYTVEYYKDSITAENKLAIAIGKAKEFGTQLTAEIVAEDLGKTWINAHKPDGYKDGTVQGGYPTIQVSGNVVKVLYVK
ncbi:MAG: hypothetical protein ACLUKQ_06760, partial [Peptococcaceae bacterium]